MIELKEYGACRGSSSSYTLVELRWIYLGNNSNIFLFCRVLNALNIYNGGNYDQAKNEFVMHILN